jgi:hypothetical protein
MLERARALLAADPTAALAQANAHATEFRDGQLVAERELIAIDALQQLGRSKEARSRGEALIRHFPSSIYVARVRRLLTTLP